MDKTIYNQELHNFYCSVNQMNDDEMDGLVACTGEKRNANNFGGET
jgi:homoserine trans-succinylase